MFEGRNVMMKKDMVTKPRRAS